MKFLVKAVLITGEFQGKTIDAIDRTVATEAVMKILRQHKEIAFMTIAVLGVVAINPDPFLKIERYTA